MCQYVKRFCVPRLIIYVFVHFFYFVYMTYDIKVVPSTLDAVGLLMVGTIVTWE